MLIETIFFDKEQSVAGSIRTRDFYKNILVINNDGSRNRVTFIVPARPMYQLIQLCFINNP